jgi:hypothetical protein
MDEISNKTLATLLVVAIVISLAGTFFAMRGVSQITNIVTGAQSTGETGQAKVNITEKTEITLTQTIVSFGQGYKNASYSPGAATTECNLTTNDTAADVNNTNCWISDSNYDPNPFVLENTGNNYVNVTINSSIVDDFLSGSVTGGTRRYQWAGSDLSSGYFPSAENGCVGTLNDTWQEFNNGYQPLCTNMSPFSGEDEFNIDINISIPTGVLGSKTTDVLFTAQKAMQAGGV